MQAQPAEQCVAAREKRQHAVTTSLRRRHSAPPASCADVNGNADEQATTGAVNLSKLAVCTTVYSLLEGVVTYPYDLVKTRQQVAPSGSRVTQMGTTAYVHQMIRERGATSLYRGFGWNVLGGVPSEVAYYATYTQAKHAMLRTQMGQQCPSAVFACAGVLADFVSVLLFVPADIISQRMQMQGLRADAAAGFAQCGGGDGVDSGTVLHSSARASSAPAGPTVSSTARRVEWLRALSNGHSHCGASLSSRGGPVTAAAAAASAAPSCSPIVHPGGFQLAMRICQREGVLGLWRGTLATVLSQAPNSAVWWLTHEESKQRLARRFGCSEEHALLLAVSGASAGVASSIATNPLDVLKTRLQCSEASVSLRHVLSGVFRESGWRGLYSGLIPRLAAAVPRSICTLLAYERAVAWCRNDSLQPCDS
jgi:hypothetical protein